MTRLDELSRKLCTTQAEIFSASTTVSEGGSAVFVRRFMRSDLARRMDAGSFPFESISSEQAVKLVEAAFEGKPYGSEVYSADEMYWMGYFYRAFCIATDRPSKAAYSTIGARELRSLYFPYHSLDVEQAVERVMEAKGAAAEGVAAEGVAAEGVAAEGAPLGNQLERGVSVLRRIRGL